MTETISIKDALDLFSSHREAIFTMWGFYSTVTLAVLGLTVGSDKVTHSALTTRIIQIGYTIFTLGNMMVIYSSQFELIEMAKTIKTEILPCKLAGLSSDPVHPDLFMVFHIFTATAVICAIQLKHKEQQTSP